MTDLTQTEIDALLDTLRAHDMDGERGFTVKEIRTATGWSLIRARDSLRPLIVAGKIRPAQVARGIADGYLRPSQVSGYVRVA